MKRYYIIDGYNEKFATLSEAKRHTTFWTEKEKRAEIGTYIIGYARENIISNTEIIGVKNGCCLFGRTVKEFT